MRVISEKQYRELTQCGKETPPFYENNHGSACHYADTCSRISCIAFNELFDVPGYVKMLYEKRGK